MQISKLSLWICALALGGALAMQAADTAAQAAARKALIDALNNPPAGGKTPPKAPAAPAASAKVAPSATPAAPAKPPTAAAPAPTAKPQPGDSAPQAKARAALQQQMGAAAPVLSSKEQKLQDLLARYKADELTPQEYHEQRAAILAGP